VLTEHVQLLERDEPRARLDAALDGARRGHGVIVSVEGEAGIGKTSLALSFAEAHRDDARVFIGGCEHLITPEPLGPLRDIARDSAGRFSISSGGALATYEALLRLLASGRGPALMVIEDIHWADDATLDLIRYLGRRIRGVPALVVLTARNEALTGERLASLWVDIARDARSRVELEPLSIEAVRQLSRPTGRAAQEVFGATGGNPFHVTEYLASRGEDVPSSIQDATLARASHLSPRARRVLDCASIFPRQIDEAVLREMCGDADSAGIEECLRGGMLQTRGGALAFRHELARRAVLDAIAPLRRRELHADALKRLKDRAGARAAEIAHHARMAGAQDDLFHYSVRAAQEATALGAHREAVAHLGAALDTDVQITDADRGELLVQQAEAGERCGALVEANPAVAAAIALFRRTKDPLGLGNALRTAARLAWLSGDSAAAKTHSVESLDVLCDFPDSWQYAIALSGQSQLDMLADRIDSAIQRGSEAMERAKRLGRDDIYFHALTNVSASRCSRDLVAGLPGLYEAIDEANQAGAIDALPRLYSNLTFIKSHARIYDGLLADCEAGIQVSSARDNAPIEGYIRGARANALLDLGRPREALAEAEGVLAGHYPLGITRIPALIVASRARVRLGLPEGGALDEARSLSTSRRDILRLAPLAVADAEAEWLGVAQSNAVAALQTAFDAIRGAWGEVWTLGETAMWLHLLGGPAPLPSAPPGVADKPQWLMIAGDWRGAAKAWAALGCPFEEAIALSLGDEAAQRAALAIFDRLEYAPAASRLRRIMREKGVRGVPTGPRSARRNDPLGLTPRQNQVLDLLAEGLSNVEIAERLNTSAKTVEHHVSAVLAALDAPSRLRAVQIARERRSEN
jgi:DNA-binding CsgD family transcriptional regulator